MPVMDEFKEERAAMKEKSFKEKFEYFWDYHKWHVIISVLAVAMVGTFVYQLVTRKETAFFAAMLNCYDMTNASGEYAAAFETYAGINSEEESALFDTTMVIDMDNMNNDLTKSSLEKMMVYLAAQEIDVVMGDETVMENYANNTTFMDLRELLTPEQIAKYEDDFYYIDQAIIDEKEAQEAALNYDYVAVYPDPKSPELMKDPVPVGIYLDEDAALMESYFFSGKNPLIAVPINTEHAEMASLYIDYVMSE